MFLYAIESFLVVYITVGAVLNFSFNALLHQMRRKVERHASLKKSAD